MIGSVLLAFVCLFPLTIAPAHAAKKVTICHVPPGNPANAHTISVGEPAVSAHLAHGDYTGPCSTSCQVEASLCDDGNACTSDTCGSNGECGHAPVSCDDGNPCTQDLCDPASGCDAAANDGVVCDDGNDCTSGDACAGTSCEGTPIAGCCTTDAGCDDEDPCTVDVCGDNSCTNDAKDCSVANQCVAGFCDAAGDCGTAPVSCDDFDFCTDDACDPATGCTHGPTANPPEAAETSCNDGLDNDCDGAADGADPDCAVCGDGIVQAGEECDDGANNGDTKPCTASCRTAICGDGLVCSDPGCTSGLRCEQTCDPLADTCDEPTCTPVPEACDDGNDTEFPCNSTCNWEGQQD
jgi:hypothetical protein